MKRLVPVTLVLVCAVLAVAVGAAAKKSPNEELVKDYVDLWNKGDFKTVDQILATNVMRFAPTAEASAQGRDGVEARIAATRVDYPNLKVSIKELEDKGDRVVLSWTAKGTYEGPEHPEAVGKKVKAAGTSIYRITNGKIAEERVSWDFLGVAEQLGIELPLEQEQQNIAISEMMTREIYENGNMDVAYQIVADDHIFHVPAGKEMARGPNAVQQRAAMFRRAFPDLRFTTHRTIADGDIVASHWTFYGTQRGEFIGIAPTDRKVEITGLSLSRIRDGKLVESWGVWDRGDLYKQLGVKP